MDPEAQRLSAKLAGGLVLLLVLGGGLYVCSSADEGRVIRISNLREGCEGAGLDPTAQNSGYSRCMELAKEHCTAEAAKERISCAKVIGQGFTVAH